MKLTKTILRNAACLIGPTGNVYESDLRYEMFMCHAVIAASTGLQRRDFYNPNGGQRRDVHFAERMFMDVLDFHGVSTGGRLRYLPAHANWWRDLEDLLGDGPSNEERQALRFDFLNLLAEAM